MEAARINCLSPLQILRSVRIMRMLSSLDRPGSTKMCGRRGHETDMEGGVGGASGRLAGTSGGGGARSIEKVLLVPSGMTSERLGGQIVYNGLLVSIHV